MHWSSEAEEEDFGSDEEEPSEAEDEETPEEEEFPDEEDKAVATEDEVPAAESADEEGVRADDEEIPPLLLELMEAEAGSVELSHPAQKKAQRASRSFSHRDLDFLKKGFMYLNINSFKNLSVNFGKNDLFYELHHAIYASK